MALRNLMNMDDFFWKSENLEIKAKNLLLGKCPNCKTGNLEAIRLFQDQEKDSFDAQITKTIARLLRHSLRVES